MSDTAMLAGLAPLLGAGVAPGTWCTGLLAAGCALTVLTLFRRIKLGSREIEAARTRQDKQGTPA